MAGRVLDLTTGVRIPCLTLEDSWEAEFGRKQHAIFSQGYFSYFFLNFAHKLWFGVSGLGSWIGFWGWGFQLMGFEACGVGLSGFYGVGALYINIAE